MMTNFQWRNVVVFHNFCPGAPLRYLLLMLGIEHAFMLGVRVRGVSCVSDSSIDWPMVARSGCAGRGLQLHAN